MNVKEIIKHPISWLAGVIAIFTTLEPTTVFQIFTATWGQLGQIFSFTMIAGMTLPQFWPPQTPVEYVALAIGIAFALKIGHGIWESYQEKL